MSKTKKTGTCTDNEFWTEVAHMGWGTKTTDYNVVKKGLFSRWTPEFANSFCDILSSKVGQLMSKIERWEKLEDKNCGCSDDGFSDLTHHIVGLGKHIYDATMADPELALKRSHAREYTESFSYCIPHGGDPNSKPTPYDDDYDPDELEAIRERHRLGDWYDLSPNKYKRWAQKNLDEYRAALAHPMSKFIQSDLSICLPPLKSLAEDGNIDAFVAAKDDVLGAIERIEQWRRESREASTEFSGLVNYWGMKNLCSDVERWMTP